MKIKAKCALLDPRLRLGHADLETTGQRVIIVGVGVLESRVQGGILLLQPRTGFYFCLAEAVHRATAAHSLLGTNKLLL